MTYLSILVIGILSLMISSDLGCHVGWAFHRPSEAWQLHPPDGGWAPLLDGAIRDDAHGYYVHPTRNELFDMVTTVSVTVTVGVSLLPDQWFRYAYTLTNQSKFPIRSLRLPIPSLTRRLSSGVVHDQDALMMRWSESDGQQDEVMTLHWQGQQGELPITRGGLLPGRSASFAFESPDPPRPSVLWARSDGWQFSLATNWSVRPPDNDWVVVPVLAPVAIPHTQGIYLDSFIKDITRSPLFKPDVPLPASVSTSQMARELVESYGTPSHRQVVQSWQQKIATLPSPSVFKDSVYAGLLYYDRLIPMPPPEEGVPTASVTAPASQSPTQKGVSP